MIEITRTRGGVVRRDAATGRVVDVQVRVCDSCGRWAYDCTCPDDYAAYLAGGIAAFVTLARTREEATR